MVPLTGGCGALPGEAESGVATGPGDGTFNDQLQGPIPSLDPATATGDSALTVLGNVGEGLYRLDEDGDPVPGMAEEVEIGGDRTRYTFTLREGVDWSNGDPVTAQDFEYAWLRAMSTDTAGEQTRFLTGFVEGGAEFAAGDVREDEVGVEATDERTLEVRLESPTPFFLELITLPVYLPLKERFVKGQDEEQGEEFAEDEESLLYNGPYELTRFDPEQGVRLEKRESYWDATSVETGTIKGRMIKGSGIDKYESGEIDVARLGPGQISEYQADVDFEQRTDFTTLSLYLNDEDTAMGNPNLRRAVRSGFDRELLVEAVLGDGSAPAYGYLPYGISSGGSDAESFRELAGDTVPDIGYREAREYWERGVDELGREPGLTVLVGYEDTEREVGSLLQEQLEENLGAEVKVEVVPPYVLQERQRSGDYQILASRQKADYDDPASYLDPRSSDSPLSGLRPVGPRYERLVDEARTETDDARRAGMFVQAERILVRQKALVAPILYPGASYLINSDVRGYTAFSHGTPVSYRHVEVDR